MPVATFRLALALSAFLIIFEVRLGTLEQGEELIALLSAHPQPGQIFSNLIGRLGGFVIRVSRLQFPGCLWIIHVEASS